MRGGLWKSIKLSGCWLRGGGVATLTDDELPCGPSAADGWVTARCECNPPTLQNTHPWVSWGGEYSPVSQEWVSGLSPGREAVKSPHWSREAGGGGERYLFCLSWRGGGAEVEWCWMLVKKTRSWEVVSWVADEMTQKKKKKNEWKVRALTAENNFNARLSLKKRQRGGKLSLRLHTSQNYQYWVSKKLKLCYIWKP